MEAMKLQKAEEKAEKAADKAAEKLDKAEKANRSPEKALKDDWATKHHELAPYITLKGRVRGGLSRSDQEKARQILESYGF